jgi:hypothetical protein
MIEIESLRGENETSQRLRGFFKSRESSGFFVKFPLVLTMKEVLLRGIMFNKYVTKD